MKKTVTLRALVQRINRRLKKDCQQLRKNRGGPYTETLGDWLVIDLWRNAITVPYINGVDDLVEFGRELGVLANYEEVKE